MATSVRRSHGQHGAGPEPRPAATWTAKAKLAEAATQTEQRGPTVQTVISRKVEYVLIMAPTRAEVICDVARRALTPYIASSSATTTRETTTSTATPASRKASVGAGLSSMTITQAFASGTTATSAGARETSIGSLSAANWAVDSYRDNSFVRECNE